LSRPGVALKGGELGQEYRARVGAQRALGERAGDVPTLVLGSTDDHELVPAVPGEPGESRVDLPGLARQVLRLLGSAVHDMVDAGPSQPDSLVQEFLVPGDVGSRLLLVG
jgi:hypothetical protein